MLNYTNANLSQIVIHQVGNKSRDEGVILSKKKIEIEDKNLEGLLLNYFLSPFKNSEFFSFYHESEIEHNNVYAFIDKIFEDRSSFFEKSKSIAKHLYEHSTHPKIKGGEVYLIYFNNCIIDNEDLVDGIGIFKSETKDVFLKINFTDDGNFNIHPDEGVNINKIDKGCLIFNTNKENGYKVCTIDTLNKTSDAQYWKNDFLKLKVCQDNYHITQNYLTIAKEFVTKKLGEEFEVTKADQIDYLNKSVNFFKENTHFESKKFFKEVFEDSNVIKSFNTFKDNHQSLNEIALVDNFEIENEAVKNKAKQFKAVLKLDKNFHVYIHGDKNMLENGVEKDGRKYYKLYYKNDF